MNYSVFLYLGFPFKTLTIHITTGVGRDGYLYSTILLPLAHEHWDIYLQFYIWDNYLVFLTPWTQEVNLTYITGSENVQDVFWTPYIRSIYVLCLRGIIVHLITRLLLDWIYRPLKISIWLNVNYILLETFCLLLLQ